ncbi:hypothetical protein AWC38_SpisGene8930 [Stylophora pistillata]|uniref:Uncharacterized protein n=1 Tax=Stylophora pistillata TaxID=50429 RepID=A0A2B4SBE2_STYPI|nr:hypothetical protein AWC38_SpisGene8930 [Stylophora pistillata]
MVWKKKSKFGIHTGQTVRKSLCRAFSANRGNSGFLVKAVNSRDVNVSEEQIRSCLKKFQVDDGLDDDNVVKESLDEPQCQLGRFIMARYGGSRRERLLYSLGKRKRWLLPVILREEIPEDYNNGSDYKVVLIERVSLNGCSKYCTWPNLRRGDCSAVFAGEDVKKPKGRKFARVLYDLRPKPNDSDKSEIVYEIMLLNRTKWSLCWPDYIFQRWSVRKRRARVKEKALCKLKRKKNELIRFGGEFRKCELNKSFLQKSLRERSACPEHDTETAYGKEKEHELISNPFENKTQMDKRNFDIGNYIYEALVATSSKSDHKTLPGLLPVFN